VRTYTLTLECGHAFRETAVEEHDGRPYNPNYVGRILRCQNRGCNKTSAVTKQVPAFDPAAGGKEGPPPAAPLNLPKAVYVCGCGESKTERCPIHNKPRVE
jgi:hypothetical protein